METDLSREVTAMRESSRLKSADSSSAVRTSQNFDGDQLKP